MTSRVPEKVNKCRPGEQTTRLKIKKGPTRAGSQKIVGMAVTAHSVEVEYAITSVCPLRKASVLECF